MATYLFIYTDCQEEEERVELQMTVVAKSTSSGKVSKNSDAKNLVNKFLQLS